MMSPDFPAVQEHLCLIADTAEFQNHAAMFEIAARKFETPAVQTSGMRFRLISCLRIFPEPALWNGNRIPVGVIELRIHEAGSEIHVRGE